MMSKIKNIYSEMRRQTATGSVYATHYSLNPKRVVGKLGNQHYGGGHSALSNHL